MATLCLNSVIEWLTEPGETASMERILWLNRQEDIAVVISLPLDSKTEESNSGKENNKENKKRKKSSPQPLPIIKSIYEIEIALKDGSAVKRTIDPLEKSIGNISQKNLLLRDQAWEIIKDIVTQEPAIYNEKLRWKLIEELCRKDFPRRKKQSETSTTVKVQPKTVYKYLRMYWLGGKIKNALLPNFHKCGAHGFSRVAEEQGTKRGREPKVMKADENSLGINVTKAIIALFETGLRLFYDNEDPPPPLRRVFKKIIDKFFNRGYETKDSVQVPILPPMGELPKPEQFIYWFHKLRTVEQKVITKVGQQKFNLNHRGLTGEASSQSFWAWIDVRDRCNHGGYIFGESPHEMGNYRATGTLRHY